MTSNQYRHVFFLQKGTARAELRCSNTECLAIGPADLAKLYSGRPCNLLENSLTSRRPGLSLRTLRTFDAR